MISLGKKKKKNLLKVKFQVLDKSGLIRGYLSLNRINAEAIFNVERKYHLLLTDN